MNKLLIATFFLLSGPSVFCQEGTGAFHAAGSPPNPKVKISWNHYNNMEAIGDICKKIAAAYPDLAQLGSIGKSFQGREMWLLTITDFKKGKADQKPGFYLDGNIHSNEIQGTEMSLYTAWYLVEMYASNEHIRQLLEDKVFYIIPTINPDGRENYMDKPNSPHSPRSGMVPVDNDRDNVVNEDGFDDIDGDGNITQMIRKSPNGRYKKDPDDARRLIDAKPEEAGEYEYLGEEGIDNDGDGKVNEDGEGYYDPNRDWGWKWMPNYVQGGAFRYPFSLPESKNILDFVLGHPNIAGAQTFHNNGGMILRGPGAEEDLATYNQDDIRIYDVIGNKGQVMIPGYRYIVIYKDLYTVFGGEIDWFYADRGIYTFTNELFTNSMYFGKKDSGSDNDANDVAYNFDKLLLFGDGTVPWKEFIHPQYGKIEVGGPKKNFTRADPGFLLESDAHRNMAFVLFHAWHMPKLEITEISEKTLAGGLTEVTAVISNLRVMPTHSSQDIKFKIERADHITIEGTKVVAAMIVDNRDLGITSEQKNDPAVIEVPSIPGMGSVTVRWIISSGKNYTIRVDSRKGGVVSRQK